MMTLFAAFRSVILLTLILSLNAQMALADLANDIRVAKQNYVETLVNLTAPRGRPAAGAAARLVQWRAEVEKQLDNQTKNVGSRNLPETINWWRDNAEAVFNYFVAEFGTEEEEVKQKYIQDLKKHIRRAETAFMQIQLEQLKAIVALLRTKLQMTDAEIRELSTRNFVPFYFAVEGRRNLGDVVLGRRRQTYNLGFSRALDFYLKYLNTQDAREFYRQSPQDFYYAVNEGEGEAIITLLTEEYGVPLLDVTNQTQRRRELGYNFLFQHITLANFKDLLQRLTNGDPEEALVMYPEALRARFLQNLYGFLFGPRIQKQMVLYQTHAVTMIMREITPDANHARSFAYRLRNMKWDLQALEAVHYSNTEANLVALKEFLGGSTSAIRELLTAEGRGDRNRRDRPAEGELILHRLSDIPAAHFKVFLRILREQLNGRELEEFLHDNFSEKLGEVMAYVFEEKGTASVPRMTEYLVARVPELAESVKHLMDILNHEAEGGKVTEALRAAIQKLSTKRHFSAQQLIDFRLMVGWLPSAQGVSLDQAFLKALRQIDENEINDYVARLPADEHGLVCADTIRDAALDKAEAKKAKASRRLRQGTGT